MSKINFNFNIPYPTFIESIVVWFVLRYRKKHYGVAFRRINLSGGKNAAKNRYAIVDPEDYERIAEHNWQLYEKESKGFTLCGWPAGKLSLCIERL